MASERLTLTRDELYKAVWERPARAVAASYGISGVALRKICLKLSVPVPPRGFWARKTAGKKVRVPSLPKLPPGKASRHTLPATAEPHHEIPAVSAAAMGEAELMHRIVVPESLDRPHRLVRRSARALRRSAKARGRSYPPSGKPCLDVTVGEASLDRALRIMDALLKALEERGYRVEVTSPEPAAVGRLGARSVTRALVDGEWVCFKLEERRKQIRVLPPKGAPAYARTTTEYPHTGRLALRITDTWSEKTWIDGKKQRIEDHLNKFVVGLVRAAAALKHARAERERMEREWEEERKRREELERRREIKRLLRQDLMARAADWATAERLHAFLDVVEQELVLRQDLNSRALENQWLVWARHEASRVAAEALQSPPWLRTLQVEELGAQVRTRVQADVRIAGIATYLSKGHFGEEP